MLHQQQRLQWSIDHLNFTVNDWGNIIYSDESTFTITRQHRQYVRRYAGERYRENCLSKSTNKAIASINVWGGFSQHGHTDLIRLPDRMKSNDYVNVLENHVLNSLDTLLSNGGFLLHDNSPVHKALRVTEWLNNHNIHALPWPSCSPDMNVIENVWGYLENNVQKDGVNNSDDLFHRYSFCWQNCLRTVQKRMKYISSMTNRVRLLNNNNGSYTKY